jgi:hypothetical protein
MCERFKPDRAERIAQKCINIIVNSTMFPWMVNQYNPKGNCFSQQPAITVNLLFTGNSGERRLKENKGDLNNLHIFFHPFKM